MGGGGGWEELRVETPLLLTEWNQLKWFRHLTLLVGDPRVDEEFTGGDIWCILSELGMFWAPPVRTGASGERKVWDFLLDLHNPTSDERK